MEIQLDMSVVADYVGSLNTHGDGVSYTTGITGATSLAEKPIQEEEEAATAAASSASSASSPTKKLSTHASQTEWVTPVAPITN